MIVYPKKTMKFFSHSSNAGVQAYMDAGVPGYGHRIGRHGRISFRCGGDRGEMLCSPVYTHVVVTYPPVPAVDAFGEKCSGSADAPFQFLPGVASKGYHASGAHSVEIMVDLTGECPEFLVLTP